MSFDSAHALLIGVGQYANLPRANVPIAVRDAQGVREVLLDPRRAGYPASQVELLHDASATRQGILDGLGRLAQVGAEDTVLLFYVGHGAYGTDGNYHLTTHDTHFVQGRVKAGTAISEAELLEKLRAIPSRKLLLLFNSCHSGELSPSFDLEEALDLAPTLPREESEAILAAGEGRIVITASRAEQKSWIGKGTLSIFTQALVDGLSGRGVGNNRGYISVFSLYEYLYEAVREAARAQVKQEQEPEFNAIENVGPFPVALFRGATDRGTFSVEHALPDDLAVHRVAPQVSQRRLKQILGERAVVVEGPVTDSAIVTGDRNTVQQARGRNVAQAGGGGSATVNDHSYRAAFDQRGQQVGTQYNVAGDFNFGAVSSQTEAIETLDALRAEVARAKAENALDEEAATDADYHLNKATQQARKPEADRRTILDHLSQAKAVLTGVGENVAAVAGLAGAVAKAIEMVQRVF